MHPPLQGTGPLEVPWGYSHVQGGPLIQQQQEQQQQGTASYPLLLLFPLPLALTLHLTLTIGGGIVRIMVRGEKRIQHRETLTE